MRTRRLVGFVVALGLTVAAAPRPEPQIVIQCDCVGRYAAWMCEALWWLLC